MDDEMQGAAQRELGYLLEVQRTQKLSSEEKQVLDQMITSAKVELYLREKAKRHRKREMDMALPTVPS